MIVYLRNDEFEKYKAISIKIAKILGDKKVHSLDIDDGALGHLLRERANILNNAAEKLPLLDRLLGEIENIDYTLIYASHLSWRGSGKTG